MGANKSAVASPKEYPPTIKGYYAQAFKKTTNERSDLKQAKRAHKDAIARDYPEYNASQRKRIMNPKNQIWGD